jgi:hypothetical protein
LPSNDLNNALGLYLQSLQRLQLVKHLRRTENVDCTAGDKHKASANNASMNFLGESHEGIISTGNIKVPWICGITQFTPDQMMFGHRSIQKSKLIYREMGVENLVLFLNPEHNLQKPFGSTDYSYEFGIVKLLQWRCSG